MAATSTLFTKQCRDICNNFPAYTFSRGDGFWWSPDKNTIFFRQPQHNRDIWDLLHEIAHAELSHTAYTLDIELIQFESRAWSYVTSVLAPRFAITVNPEHIEDHLDTYRQWMFARSTCPNCSQTGLQTKNTYSCINCKCSWRTNEARLCSLRRVRLQDQDQTS